MGRGGAGHTNAFFFVAAAGWAGRRAREGKPWIFSLFNFVLMIELWLVLHFVLMIVLLLLLNFVLSCFDILVLNFVPLIVLLFN